MQQNVVLPIERRGVSGAMYMEKIVISLLGELLALMSVFFRCRLYFISSRLQPGDPSLGMTIKREYPFLRVKCNPGIHPPLFENPNQNLATEFKDFLDRVRRLNPGLHQNFICGSKELLHDANVGLSIQSRRPPEAKTTTYQSGTTIDWELQLMDAGRCPKRVAHLPAFDELETILLRDLHVAPIIGAKPCGTRYCEAS
jgi:hypothetical protein